jgi:arylsulfatase A-like enzyme
MIHSESEGHMSRIPVVILVALGAFVVPADIALAQGRPPNFIIIFTDDQGYGDLGSFGHPTIRTPHLDRMAAEGQRWTSFYSAASVCTPSRAALLTARLPVRSGMVSNSPTERRVLFPDSAGGLPASEITIAEALKLRGYATAAIGKWHLGHLPEFLPTRHGFDSYFGIPYSNDMDWTGPNVPAERRLKTMDPKIDYWNVPLMRDAQIIERPAQQSTLTTRYTDEAIAFVRRNRERPFFLYLAHSMPHMPLFPSGEFQGKSLRGRYGDVIEEIDWNVGRLLDTLRQMKLDRQTLVVFTSDNGPWATYDQQGGSAGVLRGAKGGTFEGGMRVPAIFWGPGTIRSGVITDIGSTLDILPTFTTIAGVEAPRDRELDGSTLDATLRGIQSKRRETMFFYRGSTLFAVRHGSFKAHFFTRSEYGTDPVVAHQPPLLYNLDHDPAEKFDVAKEHPAVVAAIERIAAAHIKGVNPPPSQLEPRISSGPAR